MLEKVRELNKNKDVVPLIASFEDILHERMSLEEFEGMCLRWSYHYALNDLRYRLLPSMPYNVKNFFALPEGKRRKLMVDDPKVKDVILAFRDEEAKTRNINRSNKQWLKRMEKFFEGKNDMEKVTKIKAVLEAYLS